MNKTLYGKDKQGSYKIWQIHTSGDTFVIDHGKEGGKMTTKTTVVEGKNIGRSNETTPEQQAILEAESRINKQIDKGYRESKEELGELPILPMLCSDALKVGHKIKFPCYVSSKYDGLRCLAIRTEDEVLLKSRGGKFYTVEHIQSQLKEVMSVGDMWDGEIYIHGLPLEHIVSAAKKVNDNTPNLNFHVFDVVSDEPFEDRIKSLREVFKQNDNLFMTRYFVANSMDEIKTFHKTYAEAGYEGIVIRNPKGLYESGKRSGDMLKLKEFYDSEFQVVGVEVDRNGNGVLLIHDPVAGVDCPVCFGDFDQRKDQIAYPEKYIGKWLTVKYQKRYADTLMMQFPVGSNWRVCDNEGNPIE